VHAGVYDREMARGQYKVAVDEQEVDAEAIL
jgi:hypothetical protein